VAKHFLRGAFLELAILRRVATIQRDVREPKI